MEEFNFESDLFEDGAKETKSSNTRAEFKPLYFSPANFRTCDDLDPKFKADPKLFKQFADYLYFKGEWSEALKAYRELESLYKGNSFMTKCVLESEAWCLAKLGQTEEAKCLAEELLKDANTYESKHGLEYFLDTIKRD